MNLVKLISAGSHPEAELIKGLLATQGIPCVINGESRATDMGTEAGFAEIVLLVPEEAAAQARLLLAAQVVPEPALAPGEVPSGAICPVHEAPAIRTCSRCGSYLCTRCGSSTVPPLCEACQDRLSEKPRSRTRTKVVAWALLAVFFGVPLIIAALVRAVSALGR